jgi:hypothetical protein
MSVRSIAQSKKLLKGQATTVKIRSNNGVKNKRQRLNRCRPAAVREFSPTSQVLEVLPAMLRPNRLALLPHRGVARSMNFRWRDRTPMQVKVQ